jgi:hypothetical protein
LKEISALYGRGYWFWYGLLKNGGLQHIQTTDSGTIYVDQQDIEKWIKKNKKTITY